MITSIVSCAISSGLRKFTAVFGISWAIVTLGSPACFAAGGSIGTNGTPEIRLGYKRSTQPAKPTGDIATISAEGVNPHKVYSGIKYELSDPGFTKFIEIEYPTMTFDSMTKAQVLALYYQLADPDFKRPTTINELKSHPLGIAVRKHLWRVEDQLKKPSFHHSDLVAVLNLLNVSVEVGAKDNQCSGSCRQEYYIPLRPQGVHFKLWCDGTGNTDSISPTRESIVLNSTAVPTFIGGIPVGRIFSERINAVSCRSESATFTARISCGLKPKDSSDREEWNRISGSMFLSDTEEHYITFYKAETSHNLRHYNFVSKLSVFEFAAKEVEFQPVLNPRILYFYYNETEWVSWYLGLFQSAVLQHITSLSR